MRGSLLMTSAMATFNISDAITKAVSAEMNFGQVMMVRGLAIVLIAALALHQGALRPLRALMIIPVVLRVAGEVGGTILLLAAIVNLPPANANGNHSGAATRHHTWRSPEVRRIRWLAALARYLGSLIRSVIAMFELRPDTRRT